MSWLSELFSGGSDAATKKLQRQQQALSRQLKQAAKTRQAPKEKPAGGTQLTIQADVDIPQSIIFGRCPTAGSLAYAETYGTRGEIDNVFLAQVIAVADHPVSGLQSVFIEDRIRNPVSGDYTDGNGAFANGYAKSGTNLVQIEFHDGTQTVADGGLVNADGIGNHSKRPWTSDFVGRGRTYARIRLRYDQDKVPGLLDFRFLVNGIKLYDPRLDTTAGGSGSHRFTDLSTHAFSRNLAVFIYNILRGIYVLDADSNRQLIYGPAFPETALPYAIWAAAMDECDTVLSGETAGQYWGGGEVTVDTPPIEAIEQILRACNGTLTQSGGVFKLYVGAPGSADFFFTDGDLLADEGDSFSPIAPLGERINYVTGTYIRQEDGWIPRVAPPKSDADAIAETGRRVTADLNLPWVQFPRQMQRLQKQLLNFAKRERRHSIPLGPKFFGIEPGDVGSWTSTKNGYSSKLFVVEEVETRPNLTSRVTIREVDPTDYDWDSGVDLITEADGDIEVDRPDPYAATSFAASPYTQTTAGGLKYPGIQVTWTDPDDDNVIAVRIAIRLNGQTDPADYAYRVINDPTAEAAIIVGGLQPNTAYQVQASFETKTGRASDVSSWLDVTTPDVRISQDQLDDAINDFFDSSTEITEIASVFQENAFGKTSSEIQFRNGAVPGDIAGAAGARISLLVRAQEGGGTYPAFDGSMAAFHLDAFTDGTTKVSRAVFDVDRFVLNVGNGEFLPAFEVFTSGGDRFIKLRADTVRIDGDVIVNGSINANKLNADAATIQFLNGQKLNFNRIDASTIRVDDLQSTDFNIARNGSFSATTGGSVVRTVVSSFPLDQWTKAVIVTGYVRVIVKSSDNNDTTVSKAKLQVNLGSSLVVPNTTIASTNFKNFQMMAPVCGVLVKPQLPGSNAPITVRMSHSGNGTTNFAGRLGAVAIRV